MPATSKRVSDRGRLVKRFKVLHQPGQQADCRCLGQSAGCNPMQAFDSFPLETAAKLESVCGRTRRHGPSGRLSVALGCPTDHPD